MKKVLILLFTFLVSHSFGQTPISGVVNNYASATVFNSSNQSITVDTASSFFVGDKVLIIQMQGATIDETQSGDFGTILGYGNAGNYEIQRICRKEGNTIYFHNGFLNTYDVSGSLQLVKIPEYNGAYLTSSVTGKPWNGKTGGVIALKVNGTLDMSSSSIDAIGIGFRGGEALPSGQNCLPLSLGTYYTDKNSGDDRAMKGEGIAKYIATKECSRGPLANGGGGGNNHNGGGSGGSNYGIGGAGGQRVKTSPFTCGSVVGLDSKSLAMGYSMGKIFMGGGGGAGHGNNAGIAGEEGQHGGGIVLLICDTIRARASTIAVNGNSNAVNPESEGAGGGGAGGTILCQFNHFISDFAQPINIGLTAFGNRGGSVDNIGTSNCSGPGGGGGGGFVGVSLSALPSQITQMVQGAPSGSIASSSQSGCSVGDKNGAKDGTAGKIEYNYVINDNSTVIDEHKVSATACNKYFSPSGKFIWTTSGVYKDSTLNVAGCDSLLEIDLTIVPVDTSVVIEELTLISNAIGANYQWIDCDTKQEIGGANQSQFSPTYNGNFALVVGTNGCTDTSSCYTISTVGIEKSQFAKNVSVFPNPSNGTFNIKLPHSLINWEIHVTDLSGKIVYTNSITNTSKTTFTLNKTGYFILEVKSENDIFRTPILMQD
ncbi:MAG: T9SS type A sorting domain-containing protein [Salibacteraceae bacterium]